MLEILGSETNLFLLDVVFTMAQVTLVTAHYSPNMDSPG